MIINPRPNESTCLHPNAEDADMFCRDCGTELPKKPVWPIFNVFSEWRGYWHTMFGGHPMLTAQEVLDAMDRAERPPAYVDPVASTRAPKPRYLAQVQPAPDPNAPEGPRYTVLAWHPLIWSESNQKWEMGDQPADAPSEIETTRFE